MTSYNLFRDALKEPPWTLHRILADGACSKTRIVFRLIFIYLYADVATVCMNTVCMYDDMLTTANAIIYYLVIYLELVNKHRRVPILIVRVILLVTLSAKLTQVTSLKPKAYI